MTPACVQCESCSGRGYISFHDGVEFPVECRECDGEGVFTLGEIASHIHDDPRILRRIATGARVRVQTAQRVLKKLLDFGQPRKRWDVVPQLDVSDTTLFGGVR